jgi:hypothetical protein
MRRAPEEARLPTRPSAAPTVLRVGAADFARRPLRITTSNTLVQFAEDVHIDFSDSHEGLGSPWHLGFFAAVIVEADHVTIDLQGHELRMRSSFAARQRFFSLIELNASPFPVGTAGFTTPTLSPSDLVVRNGTLGTSSHFSVHGVEAGTRLLIEDLVMRDFEVGAVSLSGGNDICVRKCTISTPAAPLTSSEFVFLRDLTRSARRVGATTEAKKIAALALKHEGRPRMSDALVRCIVIAHHFNVGKVPDHFEPPLLQRITLRDIEFDNIQAEPIEVLAAASPAAPDDAIKDVNGNVLAFQDADSASVVGRMQATVSPAMPPLVRHALVNGHRPRVVRLAGLDRRGHELRRKSSAFVRIDGASSVHLRNLTGSTVSSYGNASAAVGIMLNSCEHVAMRNVRVGAIHLPDECTDVLDDARPASGLYLRDCKHVAVNGFRFDSDAFCGCVLHEVSDAKLQACAMSRAPLLCRNCVHLSMS